MTVIDKEIPSTRVFLPAVYVHGRAQDSLSDSQIECLKKSVFTLDLHAL
jgi:hypothetical protein